MMDYKKTLNLPHTLFPMKADLSAREPEILQKWERMGIYAKQREVMEGKDKFVLHLGPPYANGHIHLGTATTTLLKDIVVKAKTLEGFDSPLVPGWDCHGLPIELNVERKIGKPGQKVNAKEFREACRAYAQSFVDIQRSEFKRLGIIADWEHPYLTMNPTYEANIIRSLSKIIKKGHVQKGYKPVHWCLDCASALAEAEVEYMEKTSPSIDVRFAIVDAEDFWRRFSKVEKGVGPLSVPIWTTTPWTLPANQAVAVNPYLNYVLVEIDHREQILVAENLLSALLLRYNVQDHRILGRIVGEKLLNLKLQHPFLDRQTPVLLGEHVTVDTGTGAVHTAPAHGIEDYVLGQQYKLPMDNPIGDDGLFIASTPLFAGVHVNKVNEKIIAVLKDNGSLLFEGSITHSYPHCWRHKTALIFRSTPQWFISMDKKDLRKSALKAIKRVDWIPEWGESRIYGMIENRPDWCISRQRTWGVPLSLFIHKESGDLHPNIASLMEKVAQKVEKDGLEAWYALDVNEFLGKDAEQYKKISDVLDVWFDSGVSHECVLKVRPELKFPADIVLEGSDQHRGWFQSSLLTSVAMNGVEPFRAVLTHGFVVDGQGRKMSKSLGNVIAPEEVIKTLGADILRLWVASVDYRNEISASKEILNRMSEAYRRIRNTARFMLANLHNFNPETDLLPTKDMVKLDLWAVNQARLLQEEIQAAYHTYQFHTVIQKLHNFCISDMGGFYLDIIKDRQYTMRADSKGRRSAQTALYHLINALVRWLAPVLSFTAEEIWQFIPGKHEESVFFTEFYDQLPKLAKNETMNSAYWEKIREVRDAVNKEIENQRIEGRLGSALEAEVYLYCGPKLKKQLDALGEELRFVLITSYAQVVAEHAGPVDALVTDVPGLTIKVQATKNPKCERCWQRRADVGSDPTHPGLCVRCVLNVEGPGEVRKFA